MFLLDWLQRPSPRKYRSWWMSLTWLKSTLQATYRFDTQQFYPYVIFRIICRCTLQQTNFLAFFWWKPTIFVMLFAEVQEVPQEKWSSTGAPVLPGNVGLYECRDATIPNGRWRWVWKWSEQSNYTRKSTNSAPGILPSIQSEPYSLFAWSTSEHFSGGSPTSGMGQFSAAYQPADSTTGIQLLSGLQFLSNKPGWEQA